MTVLVTGGAGYIGSHTVRALRERERDVVVLDSLETGHPRAVEGTPLIVGDIADRPLVDKVLAEHGVEAVIHFAGYKNPGESMRDPGRYFATNVAGTLVLLQAMQAAGVEHLVFSSSCSVYGTPESLPVREDAPLHPESAYGESKLMVERLLRWFDVSHGLRSVSLRYFNAAGASDDATIGELWDVTQNLVPLIMKATLGHGPPVQVFGTDYDTDDGTAVRDYIHVEDLANAHVLALDYLQRGGASTALNLSTAAGSSVQQVIDLVEAVSGQTVPRTYADRRPGDPAFVYGDNVLAAEVLGWRPRYGLQEIVASAWRWHATHPEGYGERR